MTRLEEIKAREEKATKGPWTATETDDGRCDGIHHGEYEFDAIVKTDSGVYPPEMVDANFIAHSRDDIPWLIAEVERLRGLIKSVEWEEAYGEPYYYRCVWCERSSTQKHAADCEAFTPEGEVW